MWEVKSVSGESLDLRLRLVPGFDALEPQLRAMVAQRFAAVTFRQPRCYPHSAGRVRINRETLTQLLRLMNELAAEIEAAPPRLDGLLALRGVVETVEDEDDAVLEKQRSRCSTVGDSTRPAGDGKSEEGARLAALLQSQLEDLTRSSPRPKDARRSTGGDRERLLKMLASLTDLVSKFRGAGRPGWRCW